MPTLTSVYLSNLQTWVSGSPIYPVATFLKRDLVVTNRNVKTIYFRTLLLRMIHKQRLLVQLYKFDCGMVSQVLLY